MASTSGAADSRDERAGWGSRGPVATLVNELIDVLRPTEQSDRRRRGVFRHIAPAFGSGLLALAKLLGLGDDLVCVLAQVPEVLDLFEAVEEVAVGEQLGEDLF